MCGKLVEKMDEFRFPKGGPDFKVVTEWGVSGDFAVVKHTRKGTILLLHNDFENGDIKGYSAAGITQSIESLLAHMPNQLPVYLNTALIHIKI